MSVRRSSGSPGGDAAIGAERSTKRGTGLRHVHRDVLRLEVLLQPLRAALAAEARLLDAAERRAGVGDHPLVEADHAGLQALDDLESAIDVPGEDVGDE